MANSAGQAGHITDISQQCFSLAPTSLNLANLELEINRYNHEDATYILNGFFKGFPIQYAGPRVAADATNLKSVRNNLKVAKEKIDKEVAKGRVAGPFDNKPFIRFRVSPIGLVPKKVEGKFRLIHHLSYPPGESVNDYIDPKLSTVQYTNFDEAVHMIQDLGKGCLLGKYDIESAFRLLPVRPEDFELLGFQLDGKYYFDKCMPFGCSISCSTFEKFATFLEFCVKNNAPVKTLIHYLDDFLMGGRKSTTECHRLMKHFADCLQKLGVPIAEEKTEGPTTVLVFLGLELDSEEMVVRIPKEKVSEIVNKIKEVLAKEKVTLKIMQSLIGVLNFACRAVVPGRPFCRRLVDSICGLSKPHHHVRLRKSVRADLCMWLEFFSDFNGISVFHDRFWTSNCDAQLFTDSAAGIGLGFGAYFAGKWAYASWPDAWFTNGIADSIAVLELFPIVVALHIWGSFLKNKKIMFMCDNMSVVQILGSMSSKSPEIMVLLRALTLHCLKYNMVVKATHIPGKTNLLTDALSRLQITKFRQLAPTAELEPETIPNHLWGLFERGL